MATTGFRFSNEEEEEANDERTSAFFHWLKETRGSRRAADVLLRRFMADCKQESGREDEGECSEM